MSDNLSSLFERFRERNDLRALARLFDEVAPELASVAAHLSRSPDEAEDLIQATFLSAIERSASFDSSRPVVPWTIGILVLHARKQRERAGREIDALRVHQPGEADPERDAQGREDALAVGAAVKDLDPKYAPLVRRYLIDGATPALLAREFDLSPITTRVRLHRGLKQLRRLLPVGLSVAAFGAAAWRVDLASVRASVLRRAAQITGASVPVASFVSVGLAVALLAPLALAIPAWLLWRTSESPEESFAHVTTPTAPPEAPVESAASTSSARELADASSPEPELAAPNALSAANAIGARVRGHLLRPDGSPASGAIVNLHGAVGNSELLEQFGTPVNWSDPAPFHCGEAGEFELSFDPPAAFQFFLDTEADGCARANWRWTKIAPDQVIDLDAVQLEAAGTLSVRIVNDQGETLGAGWCVSVHASAPNALQGRDASYFNARVDPSNPIFKLEQLPARRVSLSASSDTMASIDEKIVEVNAGANTPFELVYHGPDSLRRIAVRLHRRLGVSIEPSPDHIWLTKPGTVARNPLPLSPLSNCFVFDDLSPGLYDVHVDDPRFEAWSQADVQPGDLVRASVNGNSAVRIAIFEANQTAYVGRYRLSVTRTSGSSFIPPPLLVSANASPPADGLVTGLVPGDYEFELAVAGHGTERVTVAALAAHETRDLVVALGWPTGIHGRVLANDGVSPMAGVDVQLTRGEVAGHTYAITSTVHTNYGEMPPILTRTTIDADGRFQFDDLQPGMWSVRAMWSKWLVADRTFSLPTATPLELVQPAFGFFAGHLLLPANARIDDLWMWVTSMNTGVPPNLDFDMKCDPSELSSDGSFRMRPIPLGEVDVGLLLYTGDIEADSIRQGTGPHLGRFTIEEGAPVEHELDVRSILPGSVRGRVLIDGVAASGGVARIYSNLPSHMQSGGRPLSVDGLYFMGGFDPNLPLQLEYTSPTGWSWSAPQTLQVESATELSLDTSIITTEREVQLVDATTNLPRANQRIAWRTGPDFVAAHDDLKSLASATATSDAQGKLHVRLPFGPVRFVALPSGTFTPSTVDWSDGNAPIVLRLQ